MEAGAPGITVHPRADGRHIASGDVRDIARVLAARRPKSEFNIEGDPRPDLIDLVHEVLPVQCTLVPVIPARSRVRQAGSPARRQIACRTSWPGCVRAAFA